MDKVAEYKKIVRQTLSTLLTDHYNMSGPITASLVADEVNGHYQIFMHGWQRNRHFYGISIHVQVKDDGKIWIYQDSSSVVIINHLEKAGIPTSQMVISWHPPVARQHTEFAEG